MTRDGTELLDSMKDELASLSVENASLREVNSALRKRVSSITAAAREAREVDGPHVVPNMSGTPSAIGYLIDLVLGSTDRPTHDGCATTADTLRAERQTYHHTELDLMEQSVLRTRSGASYEETLRLIATARAYLERAKDIDREAIDRASDSGYDNGFNDGHSEGYDEGVRDSSDE